MAGTPAPARRTTRASSHAPSVISEITQTPATRRPRPARKSPTPLPVVPTAMSHAYGSQGKITLETQSQTIDFTSRFISARGEAVGRDDDHDNGNNAKADQVQPDIETRNSAATRRSRQTSAPSSIASRRPRRSTSRRTNSIIAEVSDEDELYHEDGINGRIIRNNVDDDDYDDDESVQASSHARPGDHSFSVTDLNSTFSYVQPTAAGRSSPIRRPWVRSSSVAAAVVPPATPEEVEAARPWSPAVLWETLLRWTSMALAPYLRLPQLWKNLLYFFFLASLLLFTLSPSPFARLENSFEDLCHAIEASWSGIRDHAAKAQSAAENRANGYGQDLSERIDRVENDLGLLRGQNIFYRQSIDELKQILPEHLIVQRDKTTGAGILPINFWMALRDKILSDPVLHPEKQADASAPSWEVFIANNKARIQEIAGGAAQNTVQHALKYNLDSGHIVSRDMFIRLVEDNNAEFESKISDHLSVFESSIGSTVRSIAHNTASELINRHPSIHAGISALENLALANIARNNELAIKTMNYFSAPLGAAVVPYLTSPTHKKQQKNMLASVYTSMPWYHSNPHSPAAALERWDEVTDCWCSAESSDQGKAQIGVIMPRFIEPRSITIEHIPAQGTYDIGAAPKEFEVWVYAPEAVDDRTLQECSQQPDKGFVCIGKSKYDIHAPNHVQNFPLYSGDHVGVVNKAVVRVVNNWGQDWTCLYRIRMHGENEEEIEARRGGP